MIELIGRSLYQWDIGRQVKIKTPETVSEVHFARLGDSEALVVEPKTVDGEIVAEIPNIHLQEARNITVFLVKDDVTIERCTFQVIKRERPADYVYTETQVRTVEQLAEKLDQDIQERMSNVAEEVRGMVKDGKDGEDGEDGFSPLAKVEETVDGVKITVTDKNGTTEAIVKNGKDGADGKDGNPLQFAIKQQSEVSTDITIQDSARYRVLDVSMQGKTEQYTTTGNNVFDLSKVKTLNSAITGGKVEINDTDIRLKNVWAEEFVNNENVQKILEPNTRYTISLKVKIVSKPDVTLNTGTSILILYDSTNLANAVDMASPTEKNNWVEGQTYTYTTSFTTKDLSNAKILAYCYFDSDNKKPVGELEITELMIRKAEITDATYEPYTGGIPSPNTEFEQPVVHAGRYNEETGRYEIDVEVCNKNLLTYPYVNTTKTTNGITFTDDGGGSITIDGIAEADAFFVMQRNVDLGKNAINAIVTPSGASNGLYALSYRIYYNNTTKDISINILKGTTISNETVYPQLEKGTVSTPYIQHESKKVTLTSSRELTKWDKLEKRNGVYGWVYKGVKYVLDGSEKWGDYSTYNGFFNSSVLKDSFNRAEGYCNQLICDTKGTKGRDESGFFWIGVSGSKHIYIPNCVFYDESLEDKGHTNWINHLKEHPLEIWTYTDTEIFEPLQEAEQAALEALETYYGVTNITNSEECLMQIQYVADTKLYVDSKILAIQSAVI